MDPNVCHPPPNVLAALLSSFLILGLVLSYLPQHSRILLSRSSEGLSPWYLFLGCASSAGAFVNMVVVQWGWVRCCRVLSAGDCAVNLLGLAQVGLQWALFALLFPLYLVFFPSHLKYEPDLAPQPAPSDSSSRSKVVLQKRSTTRLWKISVGLAVMAGVHFVGSLAVAFVLLGRNEPSRPGDPLEKGLIRFADLMGLSATLFAISQYAPQLLLTWQEGFVGALSIWTMVIQVPGSVVFVISIMLREGTTWSTWIPYAITGVLQAGLLSMCLAWKSRQKRLGIDDFGRPLVVLDDGEGEGEGERRVVDERTGLLTSDRAE